MEGSELTFVIACRTSMKESELVFVTADRKETAGFGPAEELESVLANAVRRHVTDPESALDNDGRRPAEQPESALGNTGASEESPDRGPAEGHELKLQFSDRFGTQKPEPPSAMAV
mmetsp:Transcript_111099/g.321101  ORF Transcript_111099/g.321101 Transcript_111099/m.321101 type:complete len:116 (+) Transcript_111099:869-1216(+)